jgi:membrane protein DedA with SNARE-associated domain
MNPFDLIGQATLHRSYLGIGLLMVVLGPEMLMPFAGFLAYQGTLTLAGVIAAGTLGGVVGSTLLYLVARQLGEARVRRFFSGSGRYLLLKPSDLDRVLAIFRRHGEAIVMLGRAVPSIRSLVSLPAGLLPMPLGRFLFFTVIGTGLWNVGLTLSGYLLGVKWQLLESYLGIYGALTGMLAGLGLLAFLLLRLKERLLAG